MDYKISVFDSHRDYKTFLKQHENIKQQYINNTITCFMKKEYESGNQNFLKKNTYDEFLKMVMKHYVLYVQSKRLKQISIKNGYNYMCKVFLHQDDTALLFSCSLEVASKRPMYVEIHDVCVSPQETGKGRCKEFISVVCDYVKQTFPDYKIKIVCEKNNTAACKCYTNIFGAHIRETKKLYKFQI